MVLVSPMARRPKASTHSLLFFSCAMLLLCSGLHAQENCGAEVKLLLSPAETQAVVAALNASKETVFRVYFFDTSALALLSQGAILRLREGTKGDLTVKLRPPNGKILSTPSEKRASFQCEEDVTSQGANPSYSITSQHAAQPLPQTGTDVSHLLNAAQIKLFQDARISVDWKAVNRIAEITSTQWQTQSQPHLGKLALELWEWPGGKILELSTKVSSAAGSSTYAASQQLANANHLAMSPDQRVKTTIALEAITHAASN